MPITLATIALALAVILLMMLAAENYVEKKKVAAIGFFFIGVAHLMTLIEGLLI